MITICDKCNKTENILSLGFVIQQTVAVAFEFRVGHLLAELIADTLGSLTLLEAAGTVATGALKTFFDGLHYLGVFVKTYLTHLHSSMRLRTVALSA